jgi:hypothetical protein
MLNSLYIAIFSWSVSPRAAREYLLLRLDLGCGAPFFSESICLAGCDSLRFSEEQKRNTGHEIDSELIHDGSALKRLFGASLDHV